MTAFATIATATETDSTRILTGNGSERPNTNRGHSPQPDAFGRDHRIELRGLGLPNQCFRLNTEEAFELAAALLVTAYQLKPRK